MAKIPMMVVSPIEPPPTGFHHRLPARANVAVLAGTKKQPAGVSPTGCFTPFVTVLFRRCRRRSMVAVGGQGSPGHFKDIPPAPVCSRAFPISISIFPAREQRGCFRQFFLHVLHLADVLGGELQGFVTLLLGAGQPL